MRLFFKELHKLWGNKTFLIYVCVLMFANIFLLWMYNQPGQYASPPTAYLQMTKDLNGKTVAMQLEYINKSYQKIAAVNKIDYVLKQGVYDKKYAAQMMNGEYKEVFSKYREVYSQGGYLKYTNNIYSEVRFLEEIKGEIEQAAGYEDFLVSIQKKAKRLSQISIFAKEGSYDLNNIKITAKAYENMRGIPILYYPQKGLVTALNFDITDVILIFIMILIAFTIVRREKENGMLNLIRSAQGGRLKTAVAKFFCLDFSVLVMVAVLYGINLVYCNSRYGLGDLNRTIQSVPYLMRSTLKINLWQYLSLYMITKWAAAVICGVWILFCMLIVKNAISGIVFSFSMPVLHFFIRNIIPATHRLNVIKYANMVSLLKTNEILGSYRNLYWFNNMPIQLNIIETAAGITFLLIFVFLFFTAFSRYQLLNSTQGINFQLPQIFKNRKEKTPTITKVEWYKVLILNGGITVLSISIIFTIYKGYSAQNYITADEMFYAYYMQNITGRYDRESYDFLKTNGGKFELIIKAQQQMSRNSISNEEYQMITNANYLLAKEYESYTKVLQKINNLKQNPNAHLIYETGYQKLFDLTGNDNDKQDAIFSAFTLVSLLAGFFSMEKSTEMKNVIFVTPLGKKDTIDAKIKISVMLSVIVAVLSILPRLFQVGVGYGFKGLFSPAMSMKEFRELFFILPILGVMLLQILARILACITIAMITLTVSVYNKTFLFSLMISAVISALPMILYHMGVNGAEYFSIYPLFHFPYLMSDLGSSFVAIMYCVLAVGIIYFFNKEINYKYIFD